MTSINDVAALPKRLEDWADGKGYRKSFGIDAERSMAEDLRKLLSLTVQQAKALEDSQEHAHALEQRLPTSQTDDLEPEPALVQGAVQAAKENGDNSPGERNNRAYQEGSELTVFGYLRVSDKVCGAEAEEHTARVERRKNQADQCPDAAAEGSEHILPL